MNFVSVILCFGMKESTKLNTVFTLLNVFVILFVLIGGAWHGREGGEMNPFTF